MPSQRSEEERRNGELALVPHFISDPIKAILKAKQGLIVIKDIKIKEVTVGGVTFDAEHLKC